ncbi:MAG: hypothetical protein V4638_04760 [Bacteroidota bacterium]
MIALTAVFVMFRIEILHKRIMGFGQRILDENESLLETKTRDLIYENAFRDDEGRKRKSRFLGAIRTDSEKYLIEQIQKVAEIETQLVEDKFLDEIPIRGFNTQVRLVTSISNQKSKLISQMKRLLSISIFAILIPLLCLMFVPIICKCVNWSVGLLVLNYILTCIAVLYTGILVRNSIFDKDYEGLD